jgi:hypothetical protein
LKRKPPGQDLIFLVKTDFMGQPVWVRNRFLISTLFAMPQQMERLRPRQATRRQTPWDRQRRWQQRIGQDPERVVDTTLCLVHKIEYCLDLLATTHSPERRRVVIQRLRHLHKTARDIVNANILVFDSPRILETLQRLDAFFFHKRSS